MNFLSFAQINGLLIRDLYASDKIRRCPTEKNPQKKNGAYLYDGQRGFIFSWDGEARAIWWNDPNAKPFTEKEKADLRRKWSADKAKKEQSQKLAAKKAQEILKDSKLVNHGHLKYKGLSEYQGFETKDGHLFIPTRDVVSNELTGGQIVCWNQDLMKWEKKFLPGMRAKNSVFRIGSKSAQETFICEGYTTGLSIDKALKQMRLNACVLVCFSAGNMTAVSSVIEGKKYIYADNDESETGLKAAQATGIPFCMSDKIGNDANDDLNEFGVFYVIKKLQEVRLG